MTSGLFLPHSQLAAYDDGRGKDAARSRRALSPLNRCRRSASDPPGAMASEEEEEEEEEPCTLSSLPFELLKLVAENLLIHNASRLLAQSLASFAAASTTCLAVTQGELRAALVTALEEVRAALARFWRQPRSSWTHR